MIRVAFIIGDYPKEERVLREECALTVCGAFATLSYSLGANFSVFATCKITWQKFSFGTAAHLGTPL